MHITTNKTTTTRGNCSATVILSSETLSGAQLTTMELVYPRYIHSEFMTHRAFSRNAQSSRATPTKILIEEVKSCPVVPTVFYSNQAGMVGGEPLSAERQAEASLMWRTSAKFAAATAEALLETGAHKQHINRVLEPYLPIKVVVTATEWDNFFDLRLAKDAQPEMQDLALAMQEAQRLMDVQPCADLHLPYLTMDEVRAISDGHFDEPSYTMQMVSAARCARVSYYKHDGTKPTIEEDLALAIRLKKSRHMSPFEHTAEDASFINAFYANFRGWRSLRYEFEQEY